MVTEIQFILREMLKINKPKQNPRFHTPDVFARMAL